MDYEALSTLNISETQELLRRIEVLEAENSKLQSQIYDIENLKKDIEILKASIK